MDNCDALKDVVTALLRTDCRAQTTTSVSKGTVRGAGTASGGISINSQGPTPSSTPNATPIKGQAIPLEASAMGGGGNIAVGFSAAQRYMGDSSRTIGVKRRAGGPSDRKGLVPLRRSQLCGAVMVGASKEPILYDR